MLSCRSKKTPKLCVTGFCEGNPPVTSGSPSLRASYAEKVSIWWRHQGFRWQTAMSAWGLRTACPISRNRASVLSRIRQLWIFSSFYEDVQRFKTVYVKYISRPLTICFMSSFLLQSCWTVVDFYRPSFSPIALGIKNYVHLKFSLNRICRIVQPLDNSNSIESIA